MASKILWAAESVATLLTTELDNMANAATVIDGADYDNATNLFQQADFLLHLIDFDAPPTAGGYFELHIIYKLDGTLYGDGDDGALSVPVLSAATMVGIFPVDVTDGPQHIQCIGVPLSPFAFRVAVKNMCGQALTDVSTHWLKICPYNAESQ